MGIGVGGRSLGVRAACAGLVALCGVACSDGPVVVLGDRDPPRWRFAPPEVVSELSVPAKTDNPTLTADMLEIFFTSERDGVPADVFVAERASRSAKFGPARRVDGVSEAGVETSPAISPDGLTLWWASDRAGGHGDLDIWVATRRSRSAAWSEPANVDALNSSTLDIPRPLGEHARVMPMASDRETPGYYQILFATLNEGATDFAEPEPVPELMYPEKSTVDGFLSDDGLTLFYVTGPEFGAADLYVASRRSTNDAFEHDTPLDDLNTTNDERDPWLSPDGRQLYFSSDRSGHYDIYVADVREP